MLAYMTWLLYRAFLYLADTTHYGIAEMYSSIDARAPLPNDVVTGPCTNPALQPMLGRWYGRWEGMLPSQLAVESITGEEASVVYSHGDWPLFGFSRSWLRAKARIVDGEFLVFGDDAVFQFQLDSCQRHMVGTRVAGPLRAHIAMVRKIQSPSKD